LVYVLDEEDEFRARCLRLDQAVIEWESIVAQIDQQAVVIREIQVAMQRPMIAVPAGGGGGGGGGGSFVSGGISNAGSRTGGPANSGGEGPYPATAGNRPTTPAPSGGVTSNPLFRDVNQNPLFQNNAPSPSAPAERPRPQERPQAESKPSAPERSQPAESDSKSPHKLKVVLPWSLRPQIVALDPGRRLDAALGLYDRLVFQAIVRVREIRSRQAELNHVAQQLQSRYAELAADPEVLAALEELNRTAVTRITLGPEENYRENLAKMTERLLSKEGVIKDRGGNFKFSDAAGVAKRAWEAEESLKTALKKQQEHRAAESKGAYHDRLLADAVRAKNQGRIKDIQTEKRHIEETRRRLAKDVADRREAYVQGISALRLMVDESEKNRQRMMKDHQVTIAPIPRDVVARLKKAEETVTTAEVPLEADKTILRVEAAINGKPDNLRMIVDPAAENVRMSLDSARSMGLEPDDEGVTEEVLLQDGRTLRAQRMMLKSVQVGPFSAENVECLVLLEGYEGPPLLGASFLDRYSYQVDLDTAKLTLRRVEFKADSKAMK
jgi:clan AA aspartic protease (TIGR02281 family)